MDRGRIELWLNVSALLLAVGVFLPLTKLIIVGEVSYHDVAELEAYLIIGLAIAGQVLSRLYPRLAVFAPLGCWVVLFYPAIEQAMKSDSGGLLSQARDRAQGAMQEFAADLLPDLISNIADFHWGGFVFLASLISFTLLGLMRSIRG